MQVVLVNEEHEFLGQIGFGGIELGAEGPLSKNHKASYMVNYRYSVLGFVNKIGINVADGAVPEFQDLSFKFHLPTEKFGTFGLFGLGGTSKIFFDGGKESDGDYGNNNGIDLTNGSSMATIGLTHAKILGENTTWNSYISIAGVSATTTLDSNLNYTHDGKQRLYYDELSQETRLGIGTNIYHRINKKHLLSAGFSVQSFAPQYSDSVIKDNTIDEYITMTDVDQNNLMLYQAYMNWRWRLLENLTWDIGLHSQLFGYNSSKSIEPRSTLKLDISDEQSIYLGYGMHSQTQPYFLYFVKTYNDDYSDYTLTNSDLGFSKSQHFTAGYNINITENFRIKLEAYYQDLYNIPVKNNPSYFSLSNLGASFYNEREDDLVNEGTGNTKGLELTIEKYLSNNYYFLVTASLYDSKYTTLDNIERNSAFNSQYAINALCGYDYEISNQHRLTFDIKASFCGGVPLIPIDIDKSETAGEAVYDYSKAYESNAPMYYRVDFRIGYKQNMKRFSQEWALDLQNLTNHQNVFTHYYDAESNSIKHTYQLGLYPMFLYRINF